MTYGAAAALQAALFSRLSALPELQGIPVLDAITKGRRTGTFVLIGEEDVRDQSDKSGMGAEHRLTVSIVSDAAGFLLAKEKAIAISDAMALDLPPLSRGRVVGIWFLRAVARRLDEGRIRRIDLTFRARVED
jgi:hypothetical protein